MTGRSTTDDVWRDLWALMPECRGFGYNPARFRQALLRCNNSADLRHLVRRYITTTGAPPSGDGFDRCRAAGRLDATVEAVVVRHAHLFPAYIVAAAWARLADAGYTPGARVA